MSPGGVTHEFLPPRIPKYPLRWQLKYIISVIWKTPLRGDGTTLTLVFYLALTSHYLEPHRPHRSICIYFLKIFFCIFLNNIIYVFWPCTQYVVATLPSAWAFHNWWRWPNSEMTIKLCCDTKLLFPLYCTLSFVLFARQSPTDKEVYSHGHKAQRDPFD